MEKHIDQLLFIEQYLGSSDRFIAFLLEETKGNLPLWLAPTQIKILPITGQSKRL